MCRICLEEGGEQFCACKNTLVMHEQCLREWIRHGHNECEICHETFTIAEKKNTSAVTFILLLIFVLLHILLLCTGFILVRPLSNLFPSVSFVYSSGAAIICNFNRVKFENAIILLLLPAAMVYIVLDWQNWIGVSIQFVYILCLPLVYAVMWKARRVNGFR